MIRLLGSGTSTDMTSSNSNSGSMPSSLKSKHKVQIRKNRSCSHKQNGSEWLFCVLMRHIQGYASVKYFALPTMAVQLESEILLTNFEKRS